ncbi:AraC family transcriptional regulator [Bermanella sp. R86510]|uniref:AraC family transcriptional regulator n=1 Tax=unclassified Bermanella TaxID=2627862 RepID=UPI0037CC074A
MKDSAYLLRLVHEAMMAMNLDVNAIYGQVGVTQKHVNGSQERFSHSATHQFWKAAESVTGNTHIGLQVAKHLPPYRGQVLEYLFLSSPTFGDGLTRALNYQRLLSDVVQSYLDIDGQQATFVLDTVLGRDLSRHYTVCISYGVMQFFKTVTQGEFTLERMDFMFSADGYEHDYEAIFACPVRFNQANTAMVFNKNILDVKSDHAQPELVKLHEQLASEHVARLEQQDLINNVKKIIGELLDSQDVTLDAVSSRLGMSQRYLRSALAQAGTSFNQVLADYRSMLAKHLLLQTHESIEQIVFLTGFSEPSTFYRAFKRWTGQTPIEFRQNGKASCSQLAEVTVK